MSGGERAISNPTLSSSPNYQTTVPQGAERLVRADVLQQQQRMAEAFTNTTASAPYLHRFALAMAEEKILNEQYQSVMIPPEASLRQHEHQLQLRQQYYSSEHQLLLSKLHQMDHEAVDLGVNTKAVPAQGETFVATQGNENNYALEIGPGPVKLSNDNDDLKKEPNLTVYDSSELKGAFVNRNYSSRYQRNNKLGGLKNLRCFPACGFRHKERGFCGQSAEVEVIHAASMDTKNFLTWVEFVNLADIPKLQVGQVISMSEALSLQRSKEEATKPWVRGERLDEKCVDGVSAFEFNKERRGWHYGWTSSKHTCNAQHALQCYLLEPQNSDPDTLICRLVFQSPPFTLFCRRRRRFVLMPTAPLAPPQRRGIGSGPEASSNPIADTTSTSTGAKTVPKGAVKKNSLEKVENAPNGNASGTSSRTVAPVRIKRERSLSTQDIHVENCRKLEVPPSKRTPTSGRNGKSNKLEGVMKRLALIMSLVRQQQDKEARMATASRLDADFTEGELDWTNLVPMDLLQEGHVEDLEMDLALKDAFNDLSEDFLETPETKGVLDGPSQEQMQNPSEPPHEMQSSLHSSATLGEAMLDDVATYIRKESGFSRAVSQLTKQAASKTPDYAGFLELVQDHFDSYRRSRNISKADFDRIFNAAVARFTQGSKLHEAQTRDLNKSKKENSPSPLDDAFATTPSPSSSGLLTSVFGAFSSLVSSSSSSQSSTAKVSGISSTSPTFLTGPSGLQIPNLSGYWRQTPESEQAMQQLRVKVGTPWILSKMFEFMESKFEVEIRPQAGELVTRINRSWMSNTTISFVLDGEIHKWGIDMPAPFSQLSHGWTYRAWVDDNRVVLCHVIGNQQLTRIFWLSRDHAVLQSLVILEIEDSATRDWEEIGRVQQAAARDSA